MFVVEHRYAAPTRLEYLHHLLEELVAWIQRLTFFITRIFTVLGDDNDSIHCELRAAERKGLLYCRMNRHTMSLGRGTRQIVLGELIDIERNEVDVWPTPCAAPGVTEQKPIDKMLRVR